jgi:hypothetical protein
LRKNRQDLAFWFVKSTALIDSNPFLSRWNDTFWQLSSFYCRFSWTPKNPAKKYRIPLNFSMFFFPFLPRPPQFFHTPSGHRLEIWCWLCGRQIRTPNASPTIEAIRGHLSELKNMLVIEDLIVNYRGLVGGILLYS